MRDSPADVEMVELIDVTDVPIEELLRSEDSVIAQAVLRVRAEAERRLVAFAGFNSSV